MCTSVHVSHSGPADVRESLEALVRGDGAQCGAEDSRGAGQRQESQGTSFLIVFSMSFFPQVQTSNV